MTEIKRPLPEVLTLTEEIRTVLRAARATAYRQVSHISVLTNFEIGRRIVVHEQGGASRATYGKRVLAQVSEQLADEFGRGYSVENLTLMRRFYLAYRDRVQIPQTPSEESLRPISQTPSTKLEVMLSWSHYVFLLAVRDKDERRFYEIESARNGWSLTELRRQYDTSLYERLALSRDKEGIRTLAERGQIVEKPADLWKEPCVLEFLGLEERPRYSESDLESRIIDKLEHFLLELGRGFLFEGRQRRFTFEDEHYFVDLVLYNRLLRCFVLVDLKIGRLTHQDLGQMQMYVHYYDRRVKLPDEAPTIGIILCKKKNDALVEITLPDETSIRAAEYSLVLPSKADLRQKLLEWTAEEEP